MSFGAYFAVVEAVVTAAELVEAHGRGEVLYGLGYHRNDIELRYQSVFGSDQRCHRTTS